MKFALSDDERIVLAAELPLAGLDRDALGRAVARLVAVCDLLAGPSARWLAGPAEASLRCFGKKTALKITSRR